jgi:ribonuclease inhibitor
MKEYFIDFSGITDRYALHSCLKRALELPEYYGCNLDALYDCLTEMPECSITLISADTLDRLGQYGKSMISVFRDAALKNPNIKILTA